jgi:hypothetical protein
MLNPLLPQSLCPYSSLPPHHPHPQWTVLLMVIHSLNSSFLVRPYWSFYLKYQYPFPFTLTTGTLFLFSLI